jgi:hypothetical protein
VSLATRLEAGGSPEKMARSGQSRGEAQLQKAAIAMPDIRTVTKNEGPNRGKRSRPRQPSSGAVAHAAKGSMGPQARRLLLRDYGHQGPACGSKEARRANDPDTRRVPASVSCCRNQRVQLCPRPHAIFCSRVSALSDWRRFPVRP